MRVLISAYACEPKKGSEPGVGWLWSRAAAVNHDVTVITRANNASAIRAAQERDVLAASIRFEYVDLGHRALALKRRGRLATQVYYVAWQRRAAERAVEIAAAEPFAVTHHLTFAHAWLPTWMDLVPGPFVLGPIAGGQRVPAGLRMSLGVRGFVAEIRDSLAVAAIRSLPVASRAQRRADLVLCNNRETLERVRSSKPARIVPHACVDSSDDNPIYSPRPLDSNVKTAIFAGRLIPWKGAALAIRALVHAPGWRLEILGAGSDQARLDRLVVRLGLDERVCFRGLVPRPVVLGMLATADALLLPTLRDGSPLVVAEAVSIGLPVLGVATGGIVPEAERAIGLIRLVQPGTTRVVVRSLALELQRLAVESPPLRPMPVFGLASIAAQIDDLYSSVAGGLSGSKHVG